jgi:tetraacyldisaccharide-1-P 4'-kinase
MNEGSEELEPIIIWDRKTWHLRRFHDEKDRRKCESKKKFEKPSASIVCTEKDRRKCDSKTKFKKHSACIVCREKMAMECRQVSTGEHEGER